MIVWMRKVSFMIFFYQYDLQNGIKIFPETNSRLTVQHLLKLFLRIKCQVKRRIRFIDTIVRRLEEDRIGANIKMINVKMKLLKDNELLLRAILKRFYQFEKILENMLGSSRRALRSLKKRFINDADWQLSLSKTLLNINLNSLSSEGNINYCFK